MKSKVFIKKNFQNHDLISFSDPFYYASSDHDYLIYAHSMFTNV